MAMSDIEMTPVDSSNIAAIGYHAEERVLRVQFRGPLAPSTTTTMCRPGRTLG